MQMTLALAGVAAGIGALHTLAPDHWVLLRPFGRAEGWRPAARHSLRPRAASGT